MSLPDTPEAWPWRSVWEDPWPGHPNLVLGYNEAWDEPIWLVWWDANDATWRLSDGDRVTTPTHWMELDECPVPESE